MAEIAVTEASEGDVEALASFGAALDVEDSSWRCDPAMPNPDVEMLGRLLSAYTVLRADDDGVLAGYVAVRDDGVVKWIVVPPTAMPTAGAALLGWVDAHRPAVPSGIVSNPAVAAALEAAGCEVDGMAVIFRGAT